jgi:radical SAM superfamily enzyme YgiQ (UPF0313 family)
MKTAFVGPNFPDEVKVTKEAEKAGLANIRRVPLDLLYPATVVKNAGHEVRVIDGNHSRTDNRKIAEEVKEFDADIIFISSVPLNRWQCPYNPEITYSLIREIKKSCRATVVIYGPHPTIFPEKTLRESEADVAIIGEPDLAALEVVEKGRKAGSIAFLDGKRPVKRRGGYIKDIEKLPIPDYSLVPIQEYSEYILLSSRGCPAQCTFCNKCMYGSAHRARSPENVIKEIELLEENGSKELYFQDLDFCFDRKRAEKICRLMLKKSSGIKWYCETRVTSVDRELLALMKKAGCYKILFALETADPEMLKLCKKGITIERVEKVMDWCEELGMDAGFNIIFGLPGESRESMKRTADFVKKHYGRKHIEIDAGYTVVVYPGTELFRMAVKNKQMGSNIWRDMYSIAGTVNTHFKTHEEFMKQYKMIKRDIIIHKIRKRYGKLFLINPEFWLFAAGFAIGKIKKAV